MRFGLALQALRVPHSLGDGSRFLSSVAVLCVAAMLMAEGANPVLAQSSTTVTMVFGESSIRIGETTSLTFQIFGTEELTGLGFTDSLPLTDPDTRLMVTGDRLTGIVGYNVQTAVETEHHLIIAHEVTNQGDRGQLPKMAAKAKEALGFDEIEAIADAGYYRGADLLTCRDIGVTALTPRTNTSNAKAEGRFGKEAFVYLPEEDAYRCPAGQNLTHRYDSTEGGLTMSTYWCTACPTCSMKSQCTTGKQRRVKRWEHESLVEAMTARMEAIDAMAIRRETAEHPFSTIKAWMGATHFLCKGLRAVRTEMSLHVLAYNIRRSWRRLVRSGCKGRSPPDHH